MWRSAAPDAEALQAAPPARTPADRGCWRERAQCRNERGFRMQIKESVRLQQRRSGDQPRLVAARHGHATAYAGLLIVLPVAWLAAALPAAAGAADQAPASEPPAPAKSGLLDRLTFHAYVNQAYAISDHHQIVGIPTAGTTDYRTVALQFRYALDAADAVVAQLANLRLGQSP